MASQNGNGVYRMAPSSVAPDGHLGKKRHLRSVMQSSHNFWNNGYATEAASALLTWGQAHRPHDSFVGFALPNNGSSRRILERIGMKFVDYRDIARATLLSGSSTSSSNAAGSQLDMTSLRQTISPSSSWRQSVFGYALMSPRLAYDGVYGLLPVPCGRVLGPILVQSLME